MQSAIVLFGLIAAGLCQTVTPFTNKTLVSLNSYLFFNLTVQNFRLGKDIDFTKDVTWVFSDVQLMLPYASVYPPKTYDKEYVLWKDPNPACQRQIWAAVGQAPNFLAITNTNRTLFKYTAYADLISHVDFEKPFLRFTVDAFLSDSSRSDCKFVDGMDTLHEMKTYDNEELCYSQGRECNVWIGTSGWLYLGGAGTSSDYQYGFQLFPHWSLTGSRVELTLGAGKYINVGDPASSANAPAPTYGSFPYWEMGELTTNAGSMVRFYADEGILQSGLYVYSFELQAGTTFLFDLWDLDPMDARWYNMATCEVDIEYVAFIKAEFSVTGDVDEAGLRMQIVYGPDDWYLKTYKFTHDATEDTLSVKFTLHKRVPGVKTECNGATVPMFTTTMEPAPTPAPPTPAPFTCGPAVGQTCNGHGSCVAQDTCMCQEPAWVPDIVDGCRQFVAPTTEQNVATVPVVTVGTQAVVQTTQTIPEITEQTPPPTPPPTRVVGGSVITRAAEPTAAPIATPAAGPVPADTSANTLCVASTAVLACLLALLAA